MIADKYRWLLRDVSSCFDTLPEGFRCRVCRVQEKPDVLIPRDDVARHLAAHRREKIIRADRKQPDYTEALA